MGNCVHKKSYEGMAGKVKPAVLHSLLKKMKAAMVCLLLMWGQGEGFRTDGLFL